MKNLFSRITQATKAIRQNTQTLWSSNKHYIRIINLKPTANQNNKKDKICRKEESNFISTSNCQAWGRDEKCDRKIRNHDVSGHHFNILLKRNDKRFIEIKETTNGTWKLFCYFFPIKIKKGEIPLCHGDIYFLGHPYVFFLGRSVMIQYLNPLPFPLNFIRFIKKSFIELAKNVAILFSLFVMIFIGWILINWSNIPGEELHKFSGAPIIIYASDHQTPLKPLPQKRPENLNHIQEFGEYLPKALIASEDRRFYHHIGVDFLGIIRAFSKIIILKSPEGGSTINQQVARTLFPSWVGRDLEDKFQGTIFSLPTKIMRKIKEIPIALKLNASHSKEEILVAYLNSVFLGRENNGFPEAAQYYFNKSVKNIRLPEAVTLVAMLDQPNAYIDGGLCNSRGKKNLNKLSERRRRVTNWMKTEKYLKNPAEARRAELISVSNLFSSKVCNYKEENPVIPRIHDSLIYQELYDIMQDEYKQGNLILETTLDINKQRQAQDIMKNFINNKKKKEWVSQGALVSLNSTTGEIVAIVEAIEPQKEKYSYQKNGKGNPIFVDHKNDCPDQETCIKLEYNYATTEELLPASTFKVFSYTAALEEGIPLTKRYNCKSFKFDKEIFNVKTFKDNAYCKSETKDPVGLWTAIGTSDNLTAVNVAKDAGLDKIIQTAKRMGITSELKNEPRLAIGNSPVKLLEMTSAYGILANRGEKKRPHIINRIIDISSPECKLYNYTNNPNCLVLYAYNGDSSSGLKPDSRGNKQVLSPDVADTMTKLLKAPIAAGGTASNIKIPNAAGKTGTADDRKDLWFIGYVPHDLVTGIWLGNPSFERTPTEVISRDAAEIWQQYMKKIGY